jgi:hypothetical protein
VIEGFSFQVCEIDAEVGATEVYTDGITGISVKVHSSSSSSTFVLRLQFVPFVNKTLIFKLSNNATDSGT